MPRITLIITDNVI